MRQSGAKFVCSPPLRPERHREVLYKALRQGALQGISTDHCPFNFKGQKELGLGDFTKIPNGLPAIEHRLMLLYDRSVRMGHMSVVDLVRQYAAAPTELDVRPLVLKHNAARLLGLSPAAPPPD